MFFSDHGTRKVSGYNKCYGLLEKYNYANIQDWLTSKTHLLVHRSYCYTCIAYS